MKGEEFVVELVAGVEFEEFVRGDDEGVCGGVFCNLKVKCQFICPETMCVREK